MTNTDLDRLLELSQWDYVFNGNEKEELESLKAKIHGNIEDGVRYQNIKYSLLNPEKFELDTDLESQVNISMNNFDRVNEKVVKLKEENKSLSDVIAFQSKNTSNYKEELEQYKSKLEKINKIIKEDWADVTAPTLLYRVKEILDS